MTTIPAPRRFTVAEFEQMERAGILHEDDRVELIEGVIVEMSPIGSRHQGTMTWLVRRLTFALGDRAIVSPQGPAVLGDISEPQPDVLVLRPRADTYRDAHPRPDDVLLLIEVSDSSLAYDRATKLPLYARWRIRESWIISLPGDEVIVATEPSDDGYRTVVTHTRGGDVRVLDVVLAVDDILGLA